MTCKKCGCIMKLDSEQGVDWYYCPNYCPKDPILTYQLFIIITLAITGIILSILSWLY